jgi:hypothetical protein
MRKYIITIASELDGHAGGEALYLETPTDFPKKEMINMIFKGVKDDNEFVITHENENNIYGTAYGSEFSMKWKELKDFKTNKLYYLSSRTG